MDAPLDRRRAYKPGDTVPISGVYSAVHLEHREPHEVVAVRGEEFPLCRVCQAEVTFHMEHLVPHMTADFDLTGPPPETLKRKPRARAAGKGKE